MLREVRDTRHGFEMFGSFLIKGDIALECSRCVVYLKGLVHSGFILKDSILEVGATS